VDIDLRWGVTAEQADKVLELCLDTGSEPGTSDDDLEFGPAADDREIARIPSWK